MSSSAVDAIISALIDSKRAFKPWEKGKERQRTISEKRFLRGEYLKKKKELDKLSCKGLAFVNMPLDGGSPGTRRAEKSHPEHIHTVAVAVACPTYIISLNPQHNSAWSPLFHRAGNHTQRVCLIILLSVVWILFTITPFPKGSELGMVMSGNCARLAGVELM